MYFPLLLQLLLKEFAFWEVSNIFFFTPFNNPHYTLNIVALNKGRILLKRVLQYKASCNTRITKYSIVDRHVCNSPSVSL